MPYLDASIPEANAGRFGLSSDFVIGWEEWVALPDLGLPAIKAKVDTGARTSALHASVIEPFGPADRPQVRFLIQPDPDNPGLEITCSAPVTDRRNVTSSNGETELRYVIAARLRVAGSSSWMRPIQRSSIRSGGMKTLSASHPVTREKVST